MNARKFIASSISALAIVGTVGLAYAQTTTPDQVGSGSAAATPAGRTEGTTNASTTDATLTPNTMGTTAPSSADATTSTNLPAQADRG